MISEFQRRVMEALQPAATAVEENVLFWKPSEKAPRVFYIRFFDDLACKLNIQSDHDPTLVRAFLDEISLEQLRSVTQERPLGLFESGTLASTPFHLRAVVFPTLVRGAVSHTTKFMDSVTYTTFPVYRCEFTNDDTHDEAAFRVAKVVPREKWDRPPCPATSARFHRVRTGVKSTGGKRMGIFPLPEVEKIITFLAADDGFIEVENYERGIVRIEHAEGQYVVIQGDDRWTPRNDEVISWLRVFTINGLEAANKSRGNYVA